MPAQKPSRPTTGAALVLPRVPEETTQRAFDGIRVITQQVQGTIDSTRAQLESSIAATDATVATLTGRLLGRQKLTGSGTYTPTPGTTRARVRGVACGGGGGGGQGGANAAGGAGGASGEFMDTWVGGTGVAIAGGSYSAPTSGGSAGSSAGGNGGTGSDAALTIAGTTFTLKGGGGGAGMLTTAANGFALPGRAVVGAATPDVLLRRDGEPGIVVNTALFWGGAGGSTPLGAGGGTGDASGGSTVGRDPSGFGGGGGGGCVNAAGRAGAAGGPAVFIVEEYS